MNFPDSLFSHPFIYTKIRPILYLGLDYSETYGWLNCTANDIILDIGCGTGHALESLEFFNSYHGFDLNQSALDYIRLRHHGEKIHLYHRKISEKNLIAIRPTKVVAVGLLHHLSDNEIQDMFVLLSGHRTIKKIVTLDTVFVRNKIINNIISFLDRGMHVRTKNEYVDIIHMTPFKITKEDLSTDRAKNPFIYLYSTCLEPI